MAQKEDIYLWHDCLDCRDMYSDHCPLEGDDDLEKIKNRISQLDDFNCNRFMRRTRELI